MKDALSAEGMDEFQRIMPMPGDLVCRAEDCPCILVHKIGGVKINQLLLAVVKNQAFIHKITTLITIVAELCNLLAIYSLKPICHVAIIVASRMSKINRNSARFCYNMADL